MTKRINSIVVQQDDEEAEDQYAIQIECDGPESCVDLSFYGDPDSGVVGFPFSAIDDVIDGLLFIRDAHTPKATRAKKAS